MVANALEFFTGKGLLGDMSWPLIVCFEEEECDSTEEDVDDYCYANGANGQATVPRFTHCPDSFNPTTETWRSNVSSDTIHSCLPQHFQNSLSFAAITVLQSRSSTLVDDAGDSIYAETREGKMFIDMFRSAGAGTAAAAAVLCRLFRTLKTISWILLQDRNPICHLL